MSTQRQIPRLGSATLADAHAQCPAYDRRKITTGIVHIGLGAFHRAHQAVYIDGLLERDPRWGIVGVSMRSTQMSQKLDPQNGLFTVAHQIDDTLQCRIIGSVLKTISARSDAEAVLATMADPNTRIISLTITEKGYCLDPATQRLDMTHADIQADLRSPRHPISAIGTIVEALRMRQARSSGPCTILSCDNLLANGIVCKAAVIGFARQVSAGLAAWIEANTSFPSTMVDRIVPAATEQSLDRICRETGLRDEAAILTEPFSQWVVEDDFCAGRPELETVGATMVDDVRPYEVMKLRMLNGSHSTLAYLGYLAGHETVREAMADHRIRRLVRDMMRDEIMPTLDLPGTFDLESYRDLLIERFDNPGLSHGTWQIAMDGSQKLPLRLLETIRDRLSGGQSIDRLAYGIAGWMHFASGVDLRGQRIDVRDPRAAELVEIGRRFRDQPGQMVQSYLGLAGIFGSDLPRNETFVAAVRKAFDDIPNLLKAA